MGSVIQKYEPLNIVCISPAPWDYPIWTNRQHIMAIMARFHRVLYVFHPVFLKSAIKRSITFEQPWKLSALRKVNGNFSVFNPFVIPFSRSYMSIHSMNVRIISSQLKRLFARLRFDEYVLWFYDPEGAIYLDYLRPKLSCYDCVDEYSAMPYYNSEKKRRRLARLETQLISRCDLVFTTSIKLYEKKKSLNSSTFLVENVGDFRHFSRAFTERQAVPSDFPDIQGPVIGFVGALDNYKVDFELIDYLASKRPDWSIVLIGGRLNAEERQAKLPKKDNIHCLGSKPYEVLPKYVANFDACIIPYRINDYTESVFPIKLFEFLATGKPVITTALPSLEKYKDTIKIATSYDEFVMLIEESVSRDSNEARQRRISVARNNTWETRAERLLSHVYSNLGAGAI